MVNVGDLILTSVETMNVFDITTGDYLLTADELQNVSIAQNEDTTDITGKQGRKLSTLKKNKSITISGANGVLSLGMMGLQTGGEFDSKNSTIMVIDELTVSNGKAVTTYKAVGTTGNEISHIYIKNSDETLGDSLEQAAETAKGKFTYDPATKEVSFDASVAEGTRVVAYYQRKVAAVVLENNSGNYSKKCRVYVDVMFEDKCGNVYHGQFYIPKADFSGTFTLDAGENQTVHNFEMSALAGGCGAGGNFYTLTIFGVNAADVE